MVYKTSFLDEDGGAVKVTLGDFKVEIESINWPYVPLQFLASTTSNCNSTCTGKVSRKGNQTNKK